MSNTIQQFWSEVYNAFDPIVPVTNSKLREPRSKEYSPVEKIVPALQLPFGRRKILVAGGIGSGKSTELFAIGELLSQERIVILFDLWQHMQFAVNDAPAIGRLQPWELIGLIGLAVLRTGTERFNHNWKGADQRLALALSNEREAGSGQIDVAKLATGLTVAVGGAIGASAGGPLGGAAGAQVAAAGLEILKAVGGAWSWKVGLPGVSRRSDQDNGVQAIFNATAAIINGFEHELGRKVVVIVDGLDRVRQSEGFKNLFVESNLLPELPCDIVVSAHLALAQEHVGRLRFDKRYDLVNEPVADRGDPWAHNSRGTLFFRRMVQRRLNHIANQNPGLAIPPEVFPERVLDRLAWCSGGRLRDFVGFVRSISEEAYGRESQRIELDDVEPVIDAARRSRSSGLNKEQIALLREIAYDPAHELPGGKIAVDLLAQQLILPYPNQDTWYLPHPLLMLTLIRPGLDAYAESSN